LQRNPVRGVTGRDASAELAAAVRQAAADSEPLRITGGSSKQFLGGTLAASELGMCEHTGIVSHEPTELVITARAGTPLAEVEAALAEAGQMLAFEPPHFGPGATLGGAVASGLSGPRRPYAGAARDFVLGVRIINGKGERLSFGGQVMKNVAGYDVSRLMTGAWGTLGVLLDVSLKVLPMPTSVVTLGFQCELESALDKMTEWAGTALPISGTCHVGGVLHVRLAGAAAGVEAACARLGGEREGTGSEFWQSVREQTHPGFAGTAPLWRVSLPACTPKLDLGDCRVVEWSGALRWYRTDQSPEEIRALVAAAGGHATVFRDAPPGVERFHPLEPRLMALHRRVKQAFDPHGILNPGRLYPGL